MDTGGNWRGLPPQVHQDAAGGDLPPPQLPPPPPVPHSGLYLESVQLANTLRMLRVKCQTRGDNAALAMRLAAVLLLIWGLFMLFEISMVALQDVLASSMDDALMFTSMLIGLGVGGTLCLLPVVYGIVVLATAHKVFPYHYQASWFRLLSESDSVLLADEERLRILQDNLPGKFWGSAVVKQQFGNLSERLEFAAFHLPSLRLMAHQPEKPPRTLMRQTEVARQYAKHFDQQGTVIGCCIASGCFSYVQIVYVVVALLQGPRIAQAGARLAAFIDFYLEEPRLDVTRIPPPGPETTWWQRTTAPWYYRPG